MQYRERISTAGSWKHGPLVIWVSYPIPFRANECLDVRAWRAWLVIRQGPPSAEIISSRKRRVLRQHQLATWTNQDSKNSLPALRQARGVFEMMHHTFLFLFIVPSNHLKKYSVLPYLSRATDKTVSSGTFPRLFPIFLSLADGKGKSPLFRALCCIA